MDEWTKGWRRREEKRERRSWGKSKPEVADEEELQMWAPTGNWASGAWQGMKII